MAGLHRNDPGTPEGKFPVVLRRDGTVPEWDWFVLGGNDPAAIAALRAYADASEALGRDPALVAQVRNLAREWEWAQQNCPRRSDPDSPKHRRDDPNVLDFPDSLQDFLAGLRGRRSGRSA